jgi:hypothetical protein
VGAAEKSAVRLYAVADHFDAAVLAGGGESVNCALEAIERVRVTTGHTYLKRLVVPYTGNKRADAHSRCREIDAQELVDGKIVLDFSCGAFSEVLKALALFLLL